MKYGVPTQKNIFLRGLAGKSTSVPIDYNSLKQKARSFLTPEAFAYIDGSAGLGATQTANRQVFSEYKLSAQMMRSSKNVDMSISLHGNNYEVPIMAAPIGVLELAHPDADIAVANACSELNVPMIFSNQASFSMEDCADVMEDSPRWFQLYWSKSDELVQSFLNRAKKSGCEAIVVTLDTTSLGWRPQDLNRAYLPFLRAKGIAQYSSDPVFNKIVEENLYDETMKAEEMPPVNYHTVKNVLNVCMKYPGSFLSNLFSGKAMQAVRTFINIYMRPGLRWNDLEKLREMTDLPIIVKGVHTATDAEKAIDAMVDGIIVSNHGGRQIDGGRGALKCLDEITSSVDVSDVDILFDSGIRCGADVIKAISLGANAVLIGRPYVYGLTIAGEKGVKEVFQNYLAEMELQLSLMGIESIDELNRTFIKHIK